jgi:hypothetical protein
MSMKTLIRCPGCDLRYLLFPKLHAGRSVVDSKCPESSKDKKYHFNLRRKVLKSVLGSIPPLWSKPRKRGLDPAPYGHTRKGQLRGQP